MIEIATIDLIAIGFWFILVAVELGIFLYLLRLYLKSDERNKMAFAICLMFIFLVLGRSFFIYFDYFLTQLNPALYSTFHLNWKLATLFHIAGFGFLFLVSEYKVFQGKDFYIFFWGFLLIVILGLIQTNFQLGENLISYAVIFAVFIPMSYIYLAIKLPGQPRRNIILIIVGVAIFAIGMLMLSVSFVELTGDIQNIHILYLISPTLQIPGLLILAKGFKGLYFQTVE